MPFSSPRSQMFCRSLASAIITLALLLFVFFPCQVRAVEPRIIPPLDALLDPTLLASLSWKSDRKMEELVRTWPSYLGKQGFEEKLVKRQAEVEILGTRFTAEYRVYKGADIAEIVFISKSDQVGEFCSKFYEWTQTKFGSPAHFIDRSTLASEDSFKDISADWLFNSVRVQMGCGELKVYKEYISLLASIMYRHKEYLEGLKALIYIECTALKDTTVFEGTKSESASTRPSRMWIIDPDRKALLHLKKHPFGKTNSYSDEVIEATQQVKDGTIEININRVTGNYLMKVRTQKDSNNVMEEWGTCSKIEPKQKF